jgi:leader peptidase (prepilin peptidase)/N-methyltransferase
MSYLVLIATAAVAGLLGLGAVIAARQRIDVLRATGETFAHRDLSRSIFSLVVTIFIVVVTSVVVAHNVSLSLALVGLLIAVAGLAYLSLIDIDTHLLPWSDSLVIGAASCVFLVVDVISHSRGDVVVIMLSSGATAWLVFRCIEWCSRGDLGGGDVILASVLATMLGWFGAGAVIDAMVYSLVCAGVFALITIVRAGFRSQSVFAFGPFLVAGALIAMMSADPLWVATH